MIRRWATLLPAAVLIAGCAEAPEPAEHPSGSPSASSVQEAPCGEADRSQACRQQAVSSGIGYVAARLDDIDADSLAIVDYVSRRWSVPEWSSARRLIRLAHPDAASSTNPYARLHGAAARPSVAALAEAAPVDRMMGEAMSCDLRPLGSDFAALWRRMVADGGGHATHALWALMYLGELGCDPPDGVTTEVAAERVAEELSEGTEVDDLALQQLVYLTLLGQGDLVDGVWSERVLAAQQPDGSWRVAAVAESPSPHETALDWHATVLAVMWLRLTSGPDADDPGILPR